MSVIRFLPVTPEHIQHVATNMRQADVDEVKAFGREPLESLTTGVRLSDLSMCLEIDGDICCILGLVKVSMVNSIGVPWMLGTHAIMDHKREFMKQSQIVLQHVLAESNELYNYVHDQNRVSIRWLKWLGFTIEEPQPSGINGELFHKFRMIKHV